MVGGPPSRRPPPIASLRVALAFISYTNPDALAPEERVADTDNIIQIHAGHPAVMRQHWELYRELMHRPGPLSRREREMLAVRVSGLNHCPY